MTTKINRERLADLKAGKITLDQYSHPSFEDGHCAMEVVAWLADQDHTDSPPCSSLILGTYTMRLNDHWDNEQRQKLAPFLPRLVGTADDGQDEARSYLALDWLIRTFTPTWLDLAGFTGPAATLRSLNPITDLDTARVIIEFLYLYIAQIETDTKQVTPENAAWGAEWDVEWITAEAAKFAANTAVKNAGGIAAMGIAWAAVWNTVGVTVKTNAKFTIKDIAVVAAIAAVKNVVRNVVRDTMDPIAGTVTWDNARITAWNAARDALAPTVEALQTSALDLLDRMIDPSKATQ